MSQENVEIVRRSWDAFEGGSRRDPIALLFERGLFAPECTFIPPPEVPGSERCVGREELTEWFRTWTEDFLDFRFWPERIIDAGDDRVVVVARQSAKGKESGVGVELQVGFLYTLRAGQIVGVVNYLDPAEALEAVGLSE